MPDNLKTGITKPSRYEPGINRTYQDLADHYGFVVLPARVRRPRDKAKVEAAVGIVSRYVLGRLRNQRFFSLDELNEAVRDCVRTDQCQGDEAARPEPQRSVREPRQARAERAAEGTLPIRRMEALHGGARIITSRWTTITTRRPTGSCARRSTPASRQDRRAVPQGPRVAAHVRSRVAHKHSTTPEHMPSSHRRYAEWTPARMLREAARIGPATVALCEAIMKAKPHPEQGFRVVPGHSAAGEELRRSPRRGGRPARQRHRRDNLRLDPSILETRPRPRVRQSRANRTPRRSGTPISVAPAPTTEPHRNPRSAGMPAHGEPWPTPVRVTTRARKDAC